MRDSKTASRVIGPAQPVSAVMSHAMFRVAVDATLGEARELLTMHGTHHLLVFDGDRMVGVLSDRDVLAHVSPQLDTLAEQRTDTVTLRRRVFHAATHNPVTVPRRASIAVAAAIMLRHGISSLPVSDEIGGVVGVVTSNDLLRALSRMQPAA